MNPPFMTTNFHLAFVSTSVLFRWKPRAEEPADLESMARVEKKRGENRWKIAGKRRNISGVEIVAMHGFH